MEDAIVCNVAIKFSHKKEGVSFVVDSVSYPALPVPLANATGAIGDNCIYIAGGQETMTNEQSTNHFYMLDLLHKEKDGRRCPVGRDHRSPMR